MLFECKEYNIWRNAQINEGQNSLDILISSKESFANYTSFANNIFNRRKTHHESLDRNGSASSWLGTGNDGIILNDPGG